MGIFHYNRRFDSEHSVSKNFSCRRNSRANLMGFESKESSPALLFNQLEV